MSVRPLSFILLFTICATAGAQQLSVRGTFSGLWYSQGQEGHGLQVEVINERQAVLTWYAYDQDGNPFWLLGVGTIEGSTITATLSSYRGGSFPPQFDPAAVAGETWGEVTLTFANCNSGQISWSPQQDGFESGMLQLTRLTAIQGLSCGAPETFHHVLEFNFDAGPGNWSARFADYGQAQQDSINTAAEWMQLPEPLADRRGYMLAGSNTSDDLAMFLTAPIGGLEPATRYDIELEMTFATSVPQDCVGIGGSPGSSVFVKLGASTMEPQVIQEGDDFRLNIDKGGQSQGGEDALVVGDMANFQQDCPDETQWQLKTVTTGGSDFSARTDDQGVLWVYGGTDSGFEGRTIYFITRFVVRLTAAE